MDRLDEKKAVTIYPGMLFGNRKAIRRIDDRWLCVCESCGSESIVSGMMLKLQLVASCKCSQDLSKKICHMREYKQWKYSVMDGCGGKCVITGATEDLHVHHIDPIEAIIARNSLTTVSEALLCAELWEVDNGIVLSQPQHQSYHASHRGSASKESFQKWISERISL